MYLIGKYRPRKEINEFVCGDFLPRIIQGNPIDNENRYNYLKNDSVRYISVDDYTSELRLLQDALTFYSIDEASRFIELLSQPQMYPKVKKTGDDVIKSYDVLMICEVSLSFSNVVNQLVKFEDNSSTS